MIFSENSFGDIENRLYFFFDSINWFARNTWRVFEAKQDISNNEKLNLIGTVKVPNLEH